MKKITQSSDERTLIIDYGESVIPVYICLINKLPAGSGDVIVNNGLEIQEKNPNYLFDYGEGSAKLVDGYFDRSDPTVIYSFSVGKEDLVFHKHAGRRAINGVTGSGGAVVKFSYTEADSEQELFDNLVIVEIPADTQFILKFDGQTYHQFGPGHPNHNAFFAISVHPQEDQNLHGEELNHVHKGEASIPLLTIPLADNVMERLHSSKTQEITRIKLKGFE